MEEKNQGGQLNNSDNNNSNGGDGYQESVAFDAGLPGQGASFGVQNVGVNDSVGNGNIIGNDTAVAGSGGVVSLQGGKTKKEIEEQKRIEELKKKAVKLERKLTPKEKELERMHREAVKPVGIVGKLQDRRYPLKADQPKAGKTQVSPKIPAQGRLAEGWQGTSKFQDVKNNAQGDGDVINQGVDSKKQEELVENLINPIEAPKVASQTIAEQKISPRKTSQGKTKKAVNAEEKNVSLETTTEEQVKKMTEQKPVKRMVISPAGQISYVDNQEEQNSVTKNEEQINTKKNIKKNESIKFGDSSNIVNLKAQEDSSMNKQTGNIAGTVENEKIVTTPKVPEIPWEEKKVDLKTLSKEQRLDIQATPSMASVRLKMDDDLNGEVTEWFDKYNELPINIKLGLGSIEVRQEIKKFAGKFNLINEKSLGEISRIIRDVYVYLIKREDIKKRLKEILRLNEKVVNESISSIAKIVALVKDVGNKKSEEYFEKLPLKKALEKYESISMEEVTSGRILDKKNDKYIEPTVGNWIEDYINSAGSGVHTKLERGKYLNNSVNTKNLEKEDRKKIEKLIKSYDENSNLIIDREEKIVLWNAHDDESQLGINSDKNKRVINKFKIEEAQTVDVDDNISEMVVDKKKDSRKMESGGLWQKGNKKVDLNKQNVGQEDRLKNNLENSSRDSIINSRQENKNNNKKKESKEELLDLSSEIPVR